MEERQTSAVSGCSAPATCKIQSRVPVPPCTYYLFIYFSGLIFFPVYECKEASLDPEEGFPNGPVSKPADPSRSVSFGALFLSAGSWRLQSSLCIAGGGMCDLSKSIPGLSKTQKISTRWKLKQVVSSQVLLGTQEFSSSGFLAQMSGKTETNSDELLQVAHF